jgi:phosphoribosyl-ATP pyrophosphohydrolase/phosphoribosyl-AMP cyclohydrolase
MATISTMRIAQWRRCPVPGRNSPQKAQDSTRPARAFPAGGLCCVRQLDRSESHNPYEGYFAMNAVTIDFNKMDGLVPGIVQDATTGEMLMLGFLNEESYRKTLESGFVTFWSRTRSKLWMKGETSGNRLRIVSASTDCDSDALLFKVEVEGDGLVCHEGTVSCFTKDIDLAK